MVEHNEKELIEELKEEGYILKKRDNSDNLNEAQRAYKAGVEFGRAQIILEMLEDIQAERGWLLTDCYPKDIVKEYLLRYLPKRYKSDEK